MKSRKNYMRGPTYRYNAQTCRYEQTHVSAASMFGYLISLSFASLVALGSMLLLYDYFVESKKEAFLKRENSALEKHHAIISDNVSLIEAKLNALQKKDHQFEEKIFLRSSNGKEERATDQSRILTADAVQCDTFIESLKNTSTTLLHNAFAFDKEVALKINVRSKIDVLASLPLLHPVKNMSVEIIHCGFGLRNNPFHKGSYMHNGIDITVPRGTEILATAAGTIIAARKSDLVAGMGNYIEIDHGNGFLTRYQHLEELKVKPGQKIARSAVIATSGNSGGSVAPHLHYEIIRNGRPVDPIDYMINGFTSNEYETFKLASNSQNQSLD